MRIVRQKGFSLIELLIAIAVFTIGILGLTFINGNSLKENIDNSQRAVSLNMIGPVMNNFFLAANAGSEDFKLELDAFDEFELDGYENTRLINTDMLVTIVTAVDGSPEQKNLFETPAASWVSPVQISVDVTFSGVGDEDPGNDKKSRTIFTFVL